MINNKQAEKISSMLETYRNGNVSDFKEWLHKAKKIDILRAVLMHGDNNTTTMVLRMIGYLEAK